MAKPKYSATFSDGAVLTRQTDRTYTAAWRVRCTYENGNVRQFDGFSATRALAMKAAASQVSSSRPYYVNIDSEVVDAVDLRGPVTA